MAVCVGMPGQQGNAIGDSVPYPVSGLPAAQRAGNPVGEQDGEQAGNSQAICPSSATALREPELPAYCDPRRPYVTIAV